MSMNILNDQESFTRTKKKLKKLLEEKGLKLTLCETSDILSKALGFKNTFDMQKNLNVDKESEGKSRDTISNNPLSDANPYEVLPSSRPSSPWHKGAVVFMTPDGKKMPYEPYDPVKNINDTLPKITPFSVKKETIDGITTINVNLYLIDGEYRIKFNDDMISYIEEECLVNIKGHIVITGKAGVGKTTLMRELKSRKNLLSFGDINTFEYDPEEEVFSHKHLDLINKSDKNIIFCVHNGMRNQGVKILKSINNDFDMKSIQYVININTIKESTHEKSYKDTALEALRKFSEPSIFKTQESLSSHIKKLDISNIFKNRVDMSDTKTYHFMDDGAVIKEDKLDQSSKVSSPYKIEDAPEIKLNKKK